MTRQVCLLAAVVGLAAAAGPRPAGAVDVVGRKATFGWQEASGPVAAYAIYVSRNGGLYQFESGTSTNRATVSGRFGETLQVKVAAVAGSRVGPVFGPLSPSSPPIRFVFQAQPAGGNPNPSALPDVERVDRLNTRRVPPSLVLADLNGDGRDDFVWYRWRTREAVRWLSGVGRRDLVLPYARATLLAADLDGDGQDELVAQHTASGTLSRSGERGWTTLAERTAPGAELLAADVNGDGRDELLVRDRAGASFERWLVNGAAVTRRRLPRVLAEELLAVGDVNGDRRDDLLVVHLPSGRAELWISDGNLPGSRVSLASLPARAPAVLADVDGDGRADLLYPDAASGSLVVRLLAGARVRDTGPLVDGTELPLTGDVDGDGDVDLVFVGPNFSTVVSLDAS